MDNRRALRSRIITLTIPIVIQNLLSAAVGSADVLMLNYVGQSAISAVSLAVQYTNILFSVYFGLGTGAAMLCAQYYGKGDLKAIRVLEGIALRFSVSFSTISGAAFARKPGMLIATGQPFMQGLVGHCRQREASHLAISAV